MINFWSSLVHHVFIFKQPKLREIRKFWQSLRIHNRKKKMNEGIEEDLGRVDRNFCTREPDWKQMASTTTREGEGATKQRKKKRNPSLFYKEIDDGREYWIETLCLCFFPPPLPSPSLRRSGRLQNNLRSISPFKIADGLYLPIFSFSFSIL